MNTFQLDCFLAVADYLNFAKAAESLSISQPAMTHQIQSLENELNVKLFRRTTRSVELTMEGHIFLSDARNIVELSERAISRFQHTDEQAILDFSIGCTTQTQFLLLPELVNRLTAQYPHLHPRISMIPSAQILSRVEEGTVDIALGLKMDMKKGSLIYRELRKVPVICIFQEDHPLAERDGMSMEEAKQHPLILYHPGSASPEIVQLQNRLSENKKPSELYFCESAEAAMVLVLAGLGIAIMPDLFVTDGFKDYEQLHHLRKHRLTDAGEYSFGCYYQSPEGNAPLRDFIRLLRDAVKNH